MATQSTIRQLSPIFHFTTIKVNKAIFGFGSIPHKCIRKWAMHTLCTLDQVRNSWHTESIQCNRFTHTIIKLFAEITPRPEVDPSFDPNFGFPNGRKERGNYQQRTNIIHFTSQLVQNIGKSVMCQCVENFLIQLRELKTYGIEIT